MSADPPRLCLLLAACQYPGGVLDFTMTWRDWDWPKAFRQMPTPADQVRRRLAEWADVNHPSTLVWTGDRIYIDATAGLFDPGTAVDGVVDEPALTAALQAAHRKVNGAIFHNKARVLTAIDDHEILDNWEPSFHPARNAALRRRKTLGSEGFRDAVLAGAVTLPAPRGDSTSPLWYEATLPGGYPVFVTDTRTERPPRGPANLKDVRNMSRAQFAALLRWLRRQARDPHKRALHKFIVSPALVLPRRLTTSEDPATAWRSDAWDGYPRALHDLLAAIAELKVQNCVFLSGDEHMPCMAAACVARDGEANAAGVSFCSAHTGALYSPYPFTNSRRTDFSDEPFFRFTSAISGRARCYRCDLASWVPAEDTDGFTSLRIDDRHGAPDLTFTFHTAARAYDWKPSASAMAWRMARSTA